MRHCYYYLFYRMARLEILDELEEWHLLAGHYCVAWAYKSTTAKDKFASVQLDRVQERN